MGPLEFGYQGLPRDPETGLIYFRNRYYDPELGRFITADPKGYVDGPSEYAFESDDPANGSDPMGTCDKGQSPGDCIMALEAQHQKAQQEKQEKQKSLGARARAWFSQAVDWAGEKIDQAAEWVGDKAEGAAKKIGGPSTPLTAQQKELAQEAGLNPNTAAAGLGVGGLKHEAQQQAGEIANKTAQEATKQAIYQAAGAIGGKAGEALEELALEAKSAISARRLAQQLTREEAGAVFTGSGKLHPEVIARSTPIIPGAELRNPAVIKELTAGGGDINDWAKFKTPTFNSPSGPFQVHFYRNIKTGAVNYNLDYKAVFNNGVQPQP